MQQTSLILKKKTDYIAQVTKEVLATYKIEGATFADISESMKYNLSIEGGVQLIEMGDGAWADAGLEEGFIITKIGGNDMSGLEAFQQILDTQQRSFFVLGKYPEGEKGVFKVRW